MMHALGARRSLLVTVFALSAAALSAQPRIDQVQNNYSYLLPGNPNYGIAQGSIFIIKGANLANTSTGLQNSPLRTTLEGVSARVTVNGTTRDVIWYYVTPGQLGGILPSGTPAGTGTITVTNNGQTSAPAPISVVQSAFGALTVDGSGTGTAAVHDRNYSLLSASNSTKPGDAIVFYGTGLGPVSGDETLAPTQVDLTSIPVTVQIGGANATVLYRGRTQFAGLDQINVVVPSGITFGCSVPVVIRAGSLGSNNATIPVSSSGGNCPTTGGGTPGGGTGGGGTDISQAEIDRWLASGQFRSGSVSLTRSVSYSSTPGSTAVTVTRTDDFTAGFNRIAGPDLTRLFNSQVAVPAVGSCQVITGTPTNPFPNLTYQSLDAGASLGVTGPAGSRTANKVVSGTVIGYQAKVGNAVPGDYLDPGQYTFTGPGGPDVGSFSGTITVAPELVWTNRESVAVVNRNTPLTVTWSGGEPSTIVTIQGVSTTVTGTTGSVVAFTCLAKNSDRTFTVPTSILMQLPASTSIGPISLPGTLAVASVGVGTRMQASGMDYLTAGSQWGVAQSTTYR